MLQAADRHQPLDLRPAERWYQKSIDIVTSRVLKDSADHPPGWLPTENSTQIRVNRAPGISTEQPGKIT
jgi:hypothetical protein